MTTGKSNDAEKRSTHQTKTERVERAVVDVIEGDRMLIPGMRDTSLTEEEQLLFDELAAEIRSGKLDVDGDLWKLDYTSRPPDMSDFLLDDYYLGKTWRPVKGENEGIWPGWLDLYCTHLNINSRIHNMVLTGSLGVGKTALMVTAILYRACLATHLKNPYNFFGLARNSNIVYNFLSVTKEAVKDTAYGVAMTYMGDSPYFREVCRFDPEMDYAGYRIPLANTLPDGSTSKMWLTAGSKGQHVLGRNLIGIGLDEGNFRLEKDPDMTAYALYDTVRTRIANRFQRISNFLPALSIIASSAADESSFTEKVVGEIEQANRMLDEENAKLPPGSLKNPRQQVVFRNAVYKIKRHALSGITPDHHWFRVAYGLKNMEPYILSGWYKEDGTKILDDPHEEPPPGARTELVPKFYLEAYKRNTKAQLQNLSGISVGGAHRLFPSLIDIEWCLEQSKTEQIPYPLKPGIQRLPISAEDDKHIWDYLDHKAFLTRVMSRIQPKRHPNHLRYAHLDLATQTMAGVSICHLAGNQQVDGLVRDGVPFSEYRLIVEYDFILTICAGETKPINLEKIQRFFFWLRDQCNFQFGLITADMYQAEMPLQTLEARNFKVGRLSIDRDKTVYTAWRSGFEERRIRLHRNEMMIREAEQILEGDRKFDHPPDGCFTGDTRIRLLNGTVLTLKEMAESAQRTFWIYASDGKGNVVPAQAINPHRTKTATQLALVTLDNGEVIRCTPDHRFMLRDGTYVEAQNLKAGTSLMPLYTKSYTVKYKKGKGVYEQVHSGGNWKMTHKVVSDALGFGARDGEVIHHKDMRPGNNEPSNLQRLTTAEHNRLHAIISDATRKPEVIEKRVKTFKARYASNTELQLKKQRIGKVAYSSMTSTQIAKLKAATQTKEARDRTRERNKVAWSNESYRTKMAAALAAYAKSPKGRQKSSITVSLTNKNSKNWTADRLEKHVKSAAAARLVNRSKYDLIAENSIAPYAPYILGVRHAMSVAGGGSETWRRRLNGTDFKLNAENLRGLSLAEMRQKTGLAERALLIALKKLGKTDVLKYNNHKVVFVRLVEATEDVYDMEVPVYSNFALAAGVFVHNSKDTIDGAAGAFYNAVTSNERISLAGGNTPGIYVGTPNQEEDPKNKPVMDIALPPKSYMRNRVFEA